jgi:hypothetical protein
MKPAVWRRIPISMGGWVPSFRTKKVTGGAIMKARAN